MLRRYIKAICPAKFKYLHLLFREKVLYGITQRRNSVFEKGMKKGRERESENRSANTFREK